MKVEDLSKVYNNTNTKNISNKLNSIKQTFGSKLFEELLKDILAQNKAGVDQTIRTYTVEPQGDINARSNSESRNNMLRSLSDMLVDANRYNSPEATCENCNKVASDVWKRSNGQYLCSNCAKDIVEESKPSPAILRAVVKGYGVNEAMLPDEDIDIII